MEIGAFKPAGKLNLKLKHGQSMRERVQQLVEAPTGGMPAFAHIAQHRAIFAHEAQGYLRPGEPGYLRPAVPRCTRLLTTAW